MKNVLKKICNTILVLFVLLILFACNKDEIEYSLNIIVTTEIYVEEKANYEVELLTNDQDATLITDYDFSSSNSDVLKVNQTSIEGVTVGKADLIVKVVIEGNEITESVCITVKEEPITNFLNIELVNDLYPNTDSELVVKEGLNNTEITDYEVFVKDENIVKYEDGKIIGISEGTTVITVTSNYDGDIISGELSVTVCKNENTSKLVSNISNTIYNYEIIDVTLKLMPEDIEITDFVIESSDEDVFMYFDDEKCGEAISVGNVTLTIKATYNGVNYEEIIEVNVIEALSLRFELPSEISTKEPVEYKVYLMPENIEVTEYNCVSSNNNIFTVQKGIITPINVGKSRLLVSLVYDNVNVSNSIEISVIKYIPDVLISNVRNVMFINEEIDLNVKLMPSNTVINDYLITSDNTDVIKYENGKIIACGIGKAKLVINYNDISSQYEITVGEAVTGIDLEIKTDLFKNEVISYKVIARPSNLEIKDFIYNSSNDNILINNEAIFSKESGQSVITVKYLYNETEFNDSAEITANEIIHPVERVYITSSNGLIKGSSQTINVAFYPKVSSGEIEFVSSDESIVKITGNEMYGVENGKATIIANLKENSNISCKMEITIVSPKELSQTLDAVHSGNPMLARYYEDSILEYNELANGIIQTTYLGYTSTQLPGDVDGYTGLDGDIELDKYYSQQVNVLEVPSSKDLKVIPWANLNGHVWTLTTVKSLIKDYESKNPGYKVVAAVNGDFFDINGGKNLPYSTTGENVSNGEFYKTSNGFGAGGGTIGFTNDGSNNTLLGIADAIVTPYFVLSIYDENDNIIGEYKIENYNAVPEENQSSVYYGTYNSEKEYVPIETCSDNTWIIENAELALPNDLYGDFYGKGVITSTSQIVLKRGQFAITTNNLEIQNALKVGVKVRVQREYLGEFENVVSSTGYNGVIFDETHNVSYTDGNLLNRAPRTVIGMKEDGTLVMMVVDGRQGIKGMYGCDGYELAAIMKAYGCIRAYNVDGGGSSTMIIRQDGELRVLNSPSDGNERNDGNCILICTYDPTYNCEIENLTSSSVDINITIDNQEYQQYPIYLEVDGEYYETVDGKISFDNLVHNTKYAYRVYYQKDGKLFPTQTVGVIEMHKDKFKLLGYVIEETSDTFNITAYCDDVDTASNVKEMTILVNEQYYYLSEGYVSIKKSKVGEQIESIIFDYYYYNAKGEKVEVSEENPLCFIK